MTDEIPREFAKPERISQRRQRKTGPPVWRAISALLKLTLLLWPTAAVAYLWWGGGLEHLAALRQPQAEATEQPVVEPLDPPQPVAPAIAIDTPPPAPQDEAPPAEAARPPIEAEQGFRVNLAEGLTVDLVEAFGPGPYRSVVASGVGEFEGREYEFVSAARRVGLGESVRIRFPTKTAYTFGDSEQDRQALAWLNESFQVEIVVSANADAETGQLQTVTLTPCVAAPGGGRIPFANKSPRLPLSEFHYQLGQVEVPLVIPARILKDRVRSLDRIASRVDEIEVFLTPQRSPPSEPST